MTIWLNGSDLTVTQVIAAARHGEPVTLAAEVITAMRQSRVVVEEMLSKSEPVYGLTTGVGERKSFLLDPAQRQRFNHPGHHRHPQPHTQGRGHQLTGRRLVSLLTTLHAPAIYRLPANGGHLSRDGRREHADHRYR
jgi:histidine ammonia-lyase